MTDTFTILNGVCEINGDIATLTCDIGYQPDGPSISHRKQNANGVQIWDPPVLKCIPIIINNLPTVENGIVKKATRTIYLNANVSRIEEVTKNFQIGDYAVPVCNYGYEDIGPPSVLQFTSGALKWVPSVLKCTIKPPIVHNGTVRKGPFKLGDIVQITCDPGYVTKSHDSFKLEADSMGNLIWNPPKAYCVRLVLQMSPTVINGDCILPHKPPFYLNDEATVTCNPGYVSNDKYAKVDQDYDILIWRPHQIFCRPMELSAEPTIENGKYQFVTQPGQKTPTAPYFQGTTVTIQCDENHSASETESKVVVDSQTGQLKWEPDNIRCKRTTPAKYLIWIFFIFLVICLILFATIRS